MVDLYIILICLIIFLLLLSLVFGIYQKKLSRVDLKNFNKGEIKKVDSSYEVPEIIFSSKLEDTSDI